MDVYPARGGIPWYGPGAYNTMATLLMNPHALKDVQVRKVVPTWNDDELKAQDWVLSYATWEQDVGVALGEGKLIKTLLGAIPKDVPDYYLDIAALLDYPDEHHAKMEDGNDPSSDSSSDEGSLGFDPPLQFMGSFGYLCDSEGCMELSVDYVGPDPLNRQRYVPKEHSPDG